MLAETANIFDCPAIEEVSDEIFTQLAKGRFCRIEHIVSTGQSSPESTWYDQEEHEWVMVVRGAAQLEFEEGEVVGLSSGDYLNIPAHVKHRVAWTDPEQETIWLVIYYL